MDDTPDHPNGDAATEPTLDIDRHLKYWKMCLQAPLPNHYLANEGVRMTLAYFIVNSIRILTPESTSPNPAQTPKPPLIPPADHHRLRQWVLSHQQPGGGFAPSATLLSPPTTTISSSPTETDTSNHDATTGLANLPATLFALQLLALLADEGEEERAFEGVDRVQTLRWLRRLQRADGSFGEAVSWMPGKEEWFIGGGYDMRYCYIAVAVRWMLRGDVKEHGEGWVRDFDVGALERYILGSQTYDGGFAGSSQEEPHAGYAYCAIAALSLMDRPLTNSTALHPNKILHSGIRNMPALLHWLASRQFVYLEPLPLENDDEEEDEDNFLLPSRLADLSLTPTTTQHVACNGRCNKVADTCYTWWVGGALANLGHAELVDWRGSRRFLLDKMAHRIGGFSKHPGGPPDVYHGCFGLAALAVMGEPGLAEFDSALAVPVATVRVIEKARASLLEVGRGKGKGEELVKGVVEMGLAMRGAKPAWLTAAGS